MKRLLIPLLVILLAIGCTVQPSVSEPVSKQEEEPIKKERNRQKYSPERAGFPLML